MENKEGNVHTALFTAGTVLLMVGLKRIQMLLLLAEQWRSWVFLVLNLLLLAIFFTSINSSSSKNQESKINNDEEMKIERKKKRMPSQGVYEAETCYDDFNLTEKISQGKEQNEEKAENVEADNVEGEELGKMSKEELNERVEAFIAMFRQHLVLDSRKGRTTKQGDVLKFPNKTKVILPTQGVKCFVFQS
ncbi:hypothetical protein SLA2020_079370 [Shorea laevis]